MPNGLLNNHVQGLEKCGDKFFCFGDTSSSFIQQVEGRLRSSGSTFSQFFPDGTALCTGLLCLRV